MPTWRYYWKISYVSKFVFLWRLDTIYHAQVSWVHIQLLDLDQSKQTRAYQPIFFFSFIPLNLVFNSLESLVHYWFFHGRQFSAESLHIIGDPCKWNMNYSSYYQRYGGRSEVWWLLVWWEGKGWPHDLQQNLDILTHFWGFNLVKFLKYLNPMTESISGLKLSQLWIKQKYSYPGIPLRNALGCGFPRMCTYFWSTVCYK